MTKNQVILFFVALLFTCKSFAQFDKLILSNKEKKDASAIGIPDGKINSKDIGAQGGTIISDDGRVELVFPPGALQTNTTISIQPTTNNLENGTGKAYSFEPSGTKFNKPVQLLFHYTQEEDEICPAEWMSFAMQDHKGIWTYFEYDDLDSASRTLKGSIHHFSGLSNLNDLVLKPDKTYLPTNGKTVIELNDETRPISETGFELGTLEGNTSILSYANGIKDGDIVQGKVQFSLLPVISVKIAAGEYTAPAQIPNKNPVEIWVELYGRKKNKKKFLRKKLKCFIEIYSIYKVKVECEFPGRERMGSKLSDSATFFVGFFRDGTANFDQITNYPPTVHEHGRIAGFVENIFPDGTEGAIHLTQATRKGVEVTKDHPARIKIDFEPVEVVHFKFRYVYRGGITTPIEPMKLKSWHIQVDFIANGQRQQYKQDAGNKKYTVTVTPHSSRH